MSLRPIRRASTVALVAALATALPPVSSYAAQGGPEAPGWHFVDNAEETGPPLSTIDLQGTGDLLPGANGDTSSQTFTAPFPVTVNGVTSDTVVVSSDGLLSVKDATEYGTVLAFAGDQVTSHTFVQTLGEAPNRQLVVQQAGVRRYGVAAIAADFSYTFFEGRSGVLVSYDNVTDPGDSRAGLSNGSTYSADLTLEYDGTTLVTGRSIWYSDGATVTLPAIEPVVSDPFGYRAVAGQPTGSVGSLASTGRQVLNADVAQANLTLPFEFDYYGQTYTQLTASTDATFGFGASNLPGTSGWRLPASQPATGMVWADDLVTKVFTQVRGTAPDRQYVVQWVGRRYADNQASGQVSISLVLFEQGSRLGFVYDNVPESQRGIIGLNRDSTRRYEHREEVTDGDTLLWSTATDASGSIIQPPGGGTPVDPFGYRALTSGTPAGPTYSWFDTTGGDSYTLNDTGTTAITTPFPVNLYGTATTELRVHADGFLNLGTSGPTPASSFPSAAPLLVQPIDHDLISTVHTRTTGAAPHRRFVVSWDAISYSGHLPQKHQVVFHEDSTDVLVQYQDASVSRMSGGAPVGINRGDNQSRLEYAASDDAFVDELAVLYTTDSVLALTPPAELRTDGHPVSLGNGVVNPSETAHAVRQDLLVELPTGLTTDEVHLERRDGDAWSRVDLVAAGDGHRADVLETTTTLAPGADLTVPLRLAVDEDAALGDVVITSSVRTFDGATESGLLARTSRTVTLTATAPDAPTVSAEAGDGHVVLSWVPGSSGGRSVTEWQVSPVGGGDVVVVPAGELSTTVTGLANGVEHEFQVVGINAIGSSEPGRSGPVTPMTTPEAPTSVQGVAGDGQVVVSWQAPDSDGGGAITDYEVTASPGGATTVVEGSALEATMTGLANGTAYTFTVRARNAAGQGVVSAASDPVTPAGVPGTPAKPSAKAGNGQVVVSWAAVASNGSPVTGYTVTATPGGATVSVGADVTSATVTGLTNGTAYTFTVRATNAVGQGSASAASDPATPAAPLAPPAPPTPTETATPVPTTPVVAPTPAPVAPAAPGRTTVTATFKPAKVVLGRKAKLYGTVTGPTTGSVVVQVKMGRKWRAAGKATIKLQKLPNGRRATGYILSVKGKKVGKAVYRVTFAATDTWLAGTSKSVTLKVTR